jgi:hypothetical protein
MHPDILFDALRGGSGKTLWLEKPRIKWEWRDRCNRNPITAGMTMQAA